MQRPEAADNRFVAVDARSAFRRLGASPRLDQPSLTSIVSISGDHLDPTDGEPVPRFRGAREQCRAVIRRKIPGVCIRRMSCLDVQHLSESVHRLYQIVLALHHIVNRLVRARDLVDHNCGRRPARPLSSFNWPFPLRRAKPYSYASLFRHLVDTAASVTSKVSNSGGLTSIRARVSRFIAGNPAPVSMHHRFPRRSARSRGSWTATT